jgi:hypothetical protein
VYSPVERLPGGIGGLQTERDRDVEETRLREPVVVEILLQVDGRNFPGHERGERCCQRNSATVVRPSIAGWRTRNAHVQLPTLMWMQYADVRLRKRRAQRQCKRHCEKLLQRHLWIVCEY